MKSSLNLETSHRHSPTSLPPLRTTSTPATHSLATRFRRRLVRAPSPLLALLALALTVPVRKVSAQLPPVPIPVTEPATAITTSSATLNGLVYPNGDTGPAWFSWGTNTAYGNQTGWTTILGGTNAVPFSAALVGLTPSTTYHFCANAGMLSAGDQSFTTLGPPLVSTLPAAGVTTNSATLNGTVNPNGRPTTAWFQWGATTNYGNLTSVTALGSGTNALPLSAPLAGLTPSVTYHFLIAATNDYGLVCGSDQSFTTATLPPEVWTLSASTITTTSATLNGTANPNGWPATAWFQWGATTNYGNLTSMTPLGSGTNALPLSAQLAGLTPSVTYHFRIAATNHIGLACGSDQSFTTETSPTEFNYTVTSGRVTITKYTGSGNAVTIPSMISGLPVTSIGDHAFYECTSLTSVMIPNSVTSIENNAFCDCTSLTSVTIPDSVTGIGDSAFYYCTNLTSITIPNSTTNIGYAPFASCANLTAITVNALNSFYSSVDGVLFNKSQTTLVEYPAGKGASYMIPLSVTNIGNSAFFECTRLANVTIGNGVTSIGDLAFYYCTGLTSMTIPNSVTNLGDGAFYGSSSLTSVTILGSVTRIGSEVFQYCTSLTSVTIPNSVTDIGYCAFNGSGLTSVTIPNTVTSIGDYAFCGCSLTSVTIPNSVTTLGEQAFEGCYHMRSIAIGNHVTSLRAAEFASCYNLSSVTIPDSVTDIGNWAFNTCSYLISVTIPNSVTNIGNRAFQNCFSLPSITIPTSVRTIGDYAFDGLSSLTGAYFQGDAPSLGGSSVFTGDTHATVYYLPGTTGWGTTFGGLPTALWQQPLPEAWTLSASSITPTAATLNGTVNPNGSLTAGWFQWGTTTNYGNLTAATGMGSATNALPLSAPLAGLTPGSTYHYRIVATNSPYVVCGSDQSFTSSLLPTVTTLPVTGVSTNSATLNGTVNPNGWSTTAWFQWGATTNYGNLTSVNALGSGTTALPLSAPLAGLTAKVTYHFRVAARNDYGLVYGSDQNFTTGSLEAQFTYTTNNGTITITGYTGPGGAVIIPDTINSLPVTTIGTNAFIACSSLGSVTIPNSVTNVQMAAFYGCSSLTSATIGSGVTSIGDAAFANCTHLTSVAIPNSVTSIGSSVFISCPRLSSVSIGSGVTSIGDLAFWDCTGLTSIIVDTLNSAYSSADSVLFNKTQTTLVQYPAGIAAAAYTIPNGVTSVGNWAFAYCTNLTSVTIPNSVTSIGGAVFDSCTSLTSVAIPDSVTSIGGEAFHSCTSLTSITIPDSVTSIGVATFYYCTNLISVTMGSGVTSIGDSAFLDCTNLTALYFGGNVPSLGGSYVFLGDSHATVYYLPGTTGWDTTFGGRPTALWIQVPTIQSPPQTQTAEAGSALGLRVKASSPLPLLYFWYLNATNLLTSGSNWQLDLPNVQLSQSGAYTVVISNGLGAVTSAPALLNVVAAVERRPVPSVEVMGEAGSFLNVDYANSLSPAPNWTPLGSVSLAGTPQYCFDLTLPLPPQRFYRAWQAGTPGVRPSLDLHLVPAITLTGTIGHSVRLDYINQFGPIDAWVLLATVPLTNTSQLYFDVSAPGQPPRLYRLVPSP